LETIRVAIDPILIAQSGSQIHWALRQMLSACGWAWVETALNAESDLAFVASAKNIHAKLTILADAAAWQNPKGS
jgi:hypothetical protein